MTAAPTVLGWDTFVQQSMALEVAGRDTPEDAPFEVLDALPQAELPRMHDVPHDALMSAVLMPDALDMPTLMALAAAPVPDSDARDVVYACMRSVDEFGQHVMELWLVGMGALRQRRDASGNVWVRLHWRGQEWPVLVVERDANAATSIRALAESLEATLPDGKGRPVADALRLHTTLALRHAERNPALMPELMTLAYSLLMRARLGVTPGMRSPAHRALTRRMWARCVATVQARAEAEVAHSAVDMPSVASQVGPMFVPSRKPAEMVRAMRSTHNLVLGRKVAGPDGKLRASRVIVTPHWREGVSKGRHAELVITDPMLFPIVGPKSEMQAMMMEALAQYLPGRMLMPVLGNVALIHQCGGVELDGDELPRWMLLRNMALNGYPSDAASATQRDHFRKAGRIVRHWEWKVEPFSTGGGKAVARPVRVPLLVVTALEVGSNRAVRLHVNPDVLAGGRTMPVPHALFAVTNEMDVDGSMRVLGVGIVSRLVLSAARHDRALGRGESLEKALTRLGLMHKLLEKHRERGAVAAQAWLDGLLDGLRNIGPANIIGDTHVKWGKGSTWLKRARLHYGTEQPGWLARKRPAALPPASGPSVVIGVQSGA